jgi:uncharacterized protein YcbX
MFVAEIWRYPVKSMSGERLERCELGLEGIPGDRILHAENAKGRVLTARSKPLLLRHHARLDGEIVRVDERPWNDASVAQDLIAAAGESAHLVSWTGLERFDVLPLLVATDGAIATLGYDARRFRPNLIIGGVEGLAERDWEGKRLAVGGAVIFAVDLRERCIMTTFDPDTSEQNVEVLKRIRRELDGTFALNCRIEKAGPVRLGDEVRLIP